MAESHCVFHNFLTRLISPRAQDEFQTKLIPLGRFRLNLANDDSNLTILPANGRGPFVPPVVNLYLKTYQPIRNPTPREKIRTFLQGLNPFNRYPRPNPANNGFDNSYKNVIVNNLGSSQWNPIIPRKINQNDAQQLNRGNVMYSGTRNNWGTSMGEPGDLKILGPNFKILLNHRNQQMLQDARNARNIAKPNFDTSITELINRFKPSSSFGMASENANPTYNSAEDSYSNYDNYGNYKIDLENNSNSGIQVTQNEANNDVSSLLSPPGQLYNIPEPLTYLVPPSLQSNNNNMYSYNPNNEYGYSTNGPSYATKFIRNPIRDHIWSNQYDNPFNQPYPNFYQYAGWNHRADSIESEGRKYTTIPYSVTIPPNNKDKLMEKSDFHIDSTDEKTIEDSETDPTNDTTVTEEDFSSLDKVEKASNDLFENLEHSEMSEEIPLF